MDEQHAVASGTELDEVDGTWFVQAPRSSRGTLRRNTSLPSFSAGEESGNLVLPRNRSYDDLVDSDDETSETHLMEVDGKAVLAPQSERLSLKSNPYVGTFHYGHEASKKLSGQISAESSSGSIHRSPSSRKNSPQSNPISADTSVAATPMLAPHISPSLRSSGASAPADTPMPFFNGGDAANPMSPMGSPITSSPLKSPPNNNIKKVSLSRTNSPEPGKQITASDREKMKQALQLDASVPADPEMCGLQALLPRQSGIHVQYTIGEGSFGKCVKVINRKNRQEWSKSTSKRGIERHLNELPLEGDSLVVKYIKKDDPAQNALLFQGIDANLLQSAVQREIRIHAKCTHPNIVRLFGELCSHIGTGQHYDLGNKVALLLGFVEGAELHDILHVKRRLPESDCFPLVLQILRATQYMHSINVIHRDLKPRNVLVSSRLRLHVIDLGLAIDLSDPLDLRTAQRGVVGTQGYMAPESLMSDPPPPVTPLVDTWAVGVMLYEMVFGFSPFLPHELLMPCGPEFPDENAWGISASAELKDVISKLLEKQPANRLSAALALAHDWFTSDKVAEADWQLRDAATQERAQVPAERQREFSEEVMKTLQNSQGSLERLNPPLNEENEDGNIDPVHNGPFSYAYYHAIIIEGGRNDLD